ncbi:MAG: 16S rRNA (guanine(527)-N(7))-methyltransferase RsmG [Micrococcales bacterium]|nr:16S rRNA (guanine(527)-N(7))-methyltransferase RsmG [Micrococcales bacterium]
MQQFAAMLASRGDLLGVIGPGEVDRLWERHLVNSAAVVGFLPATGSVIDLGSGAGFPGVVVAAMRPDLEVELVEPMERRVSWLESVVGELGLENTVVTRARAEELSGMREADAVAVRALAPMRGLAPLVGGLLATGGTMAALKGRRVAAEVAVAQKALVKAGLRRVSVNEVQMLSGGESTWVVTAVKR